MEQLTNEQIEQAMDLRAETLSFADRADGFDLIDDILDSISSMTFTTSSHTR
ncbi:hypothetical protein SAMN05216436_13514 [bacterium A37T11]|nr:hypothetical protein SAMN05216436_13514 [bacterium A37T11]